MKTLKTLVAQISLWLVIGAVWYAALAVVARLGQRAKKSPQTLIWIRLLVLVVVGCAFLGTLLLLIAPTATDRLLAAPFFAVGADGGLGAWALWRRVPAPEKPGTVDSFTVPRSGEPGEGWPTVERARGPLRGDPNERELVKARIWQVTDLSRPIPSELLLTDRRLLLRSEGQQIEIPRARLLTVSYNSRCDRVAIEVATEEETVSIVMAGTQWFSTGRPVTRTYRSTRGSRPVCSTRKVWARRFWSSRRRAPGPG